MDYNTDNFFGFSVWYVFADNTKMYHVGSLKRAVFGKHDYHNFAGTFRDFLKEERTRVLMKRMYKKSIEYVGGDSRYNILNGNNYDICGIIRPNMSGGRCDPEYDNYLVCGELLFQFLVWLDPIFVSNLYVQMNEDNKINEAVQDIYRSKEIENTIPSIVYCIYNKGLFGKYKPKELIDLLYSCKDMTVTEVLTPRNITKVLHRYFRGHERVDNPSKKPIIDLQYVKKYIEDSYNIKHVENTK